MKITKSERFVYLSLIALLSAALITVLVTSSVLGAFSKTELQKFDLNEDGTVNVKDVTTLLNFLAGGFSLPDKAPEIEVNRTQGKLAVRVSAERFAGKEVSFLLLTDKNASKTWSAEPEKLVDLDQAAFDGKGIVEIELSDPARRAVCLVVTVDEETYVRDI